MYEPIIMCVCVSNAYLHLTVHGHTAAGVKFDREISEGVNHAIFYY